MPPGRASKRGASMNDRNISSHSPAFSSQVSTSLTSLLRQLKSLSPATNSHSLARTSLKPRLSTILTVVAFLAFTCFLAAPGRLGSPMAAFGGSGCPLGTVNQTLGFNLGNQTPTYPALQQFQLVGAAYDAYSGSSPDGNMVGFVSQTPDVCTAGGSGDLRGASVAWIFLHSAGKCSLQATAAAGVCDYSATDNFSFNVPWSSTPVFTVTTLSDNTTGAGVASNCNNVSLGGSANSNCSLRDAIAAALAAYQADNSHTPTVNFSSSLQHNGSAISSTNQGITTLSGGLVIGAGNLNIVGPGENVLSISGANEYAVFSLEGPGTVKISGLTMIDGGPAQGPFGPYGGGIEVANTALTVDHCIISGSSNTGIIVGSGATVNISYSTISGNQGYVNGGGIYIGGTAESAAVSLYYTTVSGNSIPSGGNGAGIYNHGQSPSTLNLYNSTISGNYIQGSGSGAGIYSVYGQDLANLSNTIVDGNWIGTASTVSQFDDFDDGSGFLDYDFQFTIPGIGLVKVAGNNGGNVVGPYNFPSSTQPSPAIQLAQLGFYGGRTQTLLPLPGSPAICKGLVANLPTGYPTDQRGSPKTNNSYVNYTASPICVDAGAVQTNYSLSWIAPNSAEPNSQEIASVIFSNPSPAVTLFESGSPFADGKDAITIPLALTGNGTLNGGSAWTDPVAADATAGVATYTGLSVNKAGTNDTLTANLTLNGSVTPTPSISTGSTFFDVITINPVLAMSCAQVIYDGNPHSCTGTATGPGSVPVSGSWNFNPASETTAGSYPVTGTFTSADPEYTSGGAVSGSLIITKATPVITWKVPSAIPYGTALSASQLNASSTVAGTFTYSPSFGTVLPAGPHALTVTFSPSDKTDYVTKTATVQLTVIQPHAPTPGLPVQPLVNLLQ